VETKLPGFLKPYFWDVRFEDLNVETKAKYVIGRILEKGNIKAAKWVERTYPKELIQDVLRSNRNFSLRNASFWGLIYEVPIPQLKCFYEPYRTLRKTLWPY